jgi:hypothetical protein
MGWAVLGILAVFASQFAWIRATNFGGADEWLVIDLTSRGIIDFSYANRPYVLLWGWLPALVAPHRLEAFHLAHAAYLALSGVIVYLVCRRLAPCCPLVAFLAGVLSVVWAPLDYMRLDTVLLTSYSGFTFGSLLAIWLFLESWRRSSFALLAFAALVGFVMARGFEGVLPLLASAPLLLAVMAGYRSPRFRAWAAAWTAMLALAAVIVAVPLLRPGRGSYQGSALGLDPRPVPVAGRLLRQYGFHLAPLVTTPPRELAVTAVPVAVLVFAVALGTVVRRGRPPADGPEARGALLRLLAVGLGLAGLGYGLFTLSANILEAARTQVLSAPGIGIALAAAIGLVATALPSRWAGHIGVALLGGWVVAVGTGRTVAMQQEWDEWRSRFEVQHRTLSQLTALAPRLAPNTLVVLLDEADAFWASFTFRHVVRYLYDGQAIGHVPGAKDFLYPIQFRREGILSVPWPEIRDSWGARPSLHRYDEVVVVRLDPEGRLSLLESWPGDVLPGLPPGAAYAPRARILFDGPLPASRAMLRGRD